MEEEGEEPADARRAVAELQERNEDLLEQLQTQKLLQKDLQTQLHESQRSCAQLRTQVTLVCLSEGTCKRHHVALRKLQNDRINARGRFNRQSSPNLNLLITWFDVEEDSRQR